MNERRLFALIDRSGPRSQGMLALIFVQDGKYFIGGFRGGVRALQPDADGDPDMLVKDGHILKVDDAPIADDLRNPTAHWIGDDFFERSRTVDAPQLPDIETWTRAPGGKFALDEPDIVYHRLEEWVMCAGRAALKSPNAAQELASLMVWTLPTHPVVCAIRWHTAPTTEAKDRALAWYANILRTDAKALRRNFRKLIDSLL